MFGHRGKASITLGPKKQENTTKDTIPPSHEVIKPIVLLSLCVGYTPQRLKKRGIFGGLLWLVSLFLHTAFDFMSARKSYGDAWVSIQFLLFVNLVMCTYSVRRKIVPWLETSVFQLDKENTYLKTFARIRKLFRIIPWVVVAFSFFGTGLQFFCFHYDGAFSVSFEQPVSKEWEIVLMAVWFLTNVHLLFGFSFFWCATACNMYTTGYSMTEYHDTMTTHLKNKESPFTFRQAVHSFAERGKFLKKSSSVCRISLAFLLIYSIASLAVNAFYYLYKSRKAGYIFFALMPPICSVYPLCLAAWVTKQYKWYLAVVVKAWAERPESSDEEEESGSDRPRHKDKHKSFGRKFTKRVKSAGRKDDTEDGKPRRRSIFKLAKPQGSEALSDNDPGKKVKKETRRGRLFVRSFLSGGSYSDTESYPMKKKKEKPRRGSLFVRPKSAKSASSFENEGYSREKGIFEELSPTKNTFKIHKDDETLCVSETEKISDIETANQNLNRLNYNTDNIDPLQNTENIPSFRPPNRLEPLPKTTSSSKNKELTKNDETPKDIPQNMASQNRLKPIGVRRPDSEDEDNKPSTDNAKPNIDRQNIDRNRLKTSTITEPISEGDATDDDNNPNETESKRKAKRQRVMELILRGTARAVGRLQHRAKLPKFNFEKYISYLQNVLPTVGFKIMGITVTWEMVSTLLFLEVSLLALFLQESIFGNQTAQVSL